jgi:hypothetical protein
MWKIAVVVRLVCDIVMQGPVDSTAQESVPGIWNFEGPVVFFLVRLFSGL